MKSSLCVIGNFDGVHLGHCDLLQKARDEAQARDLTLSVITFEPHPRQYFAPNQDHFRLTLPETKKKLLQSFANNVDVMHFDQSLVNLSAEDFVQSILLDRHDAKCVMVGRDFRFGQGRQGDVETLKSYHAFETVAYDLVSVGDGIVTSSRIRDLLRTGDLNQANALLGRAWHIEGEVVHGDKRGRELGYPTANMRFGEMLVPAHGVYAVKARVQGDEAWMHGAANIGVRPMFKAHEPLLEVFLFDFQGDLYGKTLEVQPVQKIREEMKFESLDALIHQMDKDCALSKSILAQHI